MRLRDNFDIALAAVKDIGFALNYASERLKDNESLFLTVYKDIPDYLHYFSKRLQEKYSDL